jgi:spermidine synthase
MVKAHLNPGGIVTQWVPLYESDLASVKSEIATFFAVFPGGMVFANTDRNDGYDTVLVGQLSNRKIDMDKITAKLASQGYKKVMASMQDAEIEGADGLFSTYSASDTDLKSWLADAQINHDYDMRLQYLAGLALNRDNASEIQRQIDSHQTTPTNYFSGSPSVLEELFSHIHGRSMAAPASD